jgi:hypothetical protein
MVAILGLLIAGTSVGTFWYLLPKNGEVHWIVTARGLEQMLPLVLISAFAVGVVMLCSIFS